MYATELDPDFIDIVRLRYGMLPIHAKTKLHVDQMKIKLECFLLLVFQA